MLHLADVQHVRRTSQMIRLATAADAAAIAAIYNYYVLSTTISFEEMPVAIDEMRHRIENIRAAGLPWLVSEHDGKIVGYAYATRWKERSAYRHSVESSIYLHRDEIGKGFARPLYVQLLAALREASMRTVIAGIAQPNEGSVRIHEKLGFERVAMFRDVGLKFGRWLDVGYWQLQL
jgi:phosphinothricin acetyltransferase